MIRAAFWLGRGKRRPENPAADLGAREPPCSRPEFAPSDRRLRRPLMPSLAHRRKKLPPLVEHALGLFHRRHHLLDRFEDVLRAEVEAAIKALDRAVN